MPLLGPAGALTSPGGLYSAPTLRPCALLLLPGYSLLAAAGVLEALRAANGLQGDARYEGHCVSLAGGHAEALTGVRVLTSAFGAAQAWHAVFVIAGATPSETAGLVSQPGAQFNAQLGAQLGAQVGAQLGAQLCALHGAGCTVAGLDGGAAVLADAGLLAGRRATVDWTMADALAHAHPEVVWSGSVWEIDVSQDAQGAALLTCAGGPASLDLLCAWLGLCHGERVGHELALQLGLERARGRDERQRQAVSERRGSGSPKLGEALALMQANLAEPLPTEDVARLVGVSRRQLERLFKQHLDALPSRYYVELRLDRARRLLQQSSQSILQIGLSCGFSSGPHFSNTYKAHFGHTPRDERSQLSAAWKGLSAAPGDSP